MYDVYTLCLIKEYVYKPYAFIWNFKTKERVIKKLWKLSEKTVL